MAKIKYVSKEKLYPAFGDSDLEKNIAYVRKDLPKIVKKFVKTHELFHLRHDQPRKWFWEEVKANAYAGIRHPWGFLLTIIMSLQPYRIKLYANMIRKGY